MHYLKPPSPTPAASFIQTAPMPVLKSTERSLPRIAGAAVLAMAMMAGLAAAAGTSSTDGALAQLTPSPLGHYLASRHAQISHDLPAAADLLAFALNADPDNRQLLETSFNLLASDGRINDALVVAKRITVSSERRMFFDLVFWISHCETFSTVLVGMHGNDFLFGILAKNGLNGVTARLRNMDKEKSLLERDHVRRLIS